MKSENGRPRFIDFGTLPDDDSLKKIQGRYSPASILMITLIGIAVAEIFAMIVIYFFRYLPYPWQVLIDALVMTVIIFPLLYFFTFRPLLRHVRQRYQVEQVLKSRLRIVQYSDTHSLEEILQYTLDELERLTGSKAGYFHFVDADQKNILLQTWSRHTLETLCQVEEVEKHYSVDKAGVWADCIRQRRVVVHNDYASLPDRRGLPPGHAPIVREMAVPVIRDGRIVAVLGVGNKPTEYLSSDIEVVSTLADFTWDIIRHKQTSDAQRASEEKFRTLADWTYDWEFWLDPSGNFIYSSPSCERLTGWPPQEFYADHHLLLSISHPEDAEAYKMHHQLVHDETAGVEIMEYRILSRSGEEHWIEHVCRPVFGENGRYLGRRISNRDVTERKQAENEIEERNRKEKVLTQTIHTMQLDIARDLHDTIGQNIGFLRMKLDHLSSQNKVKMTELQGELNTMAKAANESYDLMRGTLAVLQYGDSSDLFRIFYRHGESIEERSGIRVEFVNEGTPRTLSPGRMRQLFYVFREALTNVEKHARADRVSVSILWGDACLRLVIADNGRGIGDVETANGNHYGLKFMRERVESMSGVMNIESAKDSGTELFIQVPYE